MASAGRSVKSLVGVVGGRLLTPADGPSDITLVDVTHDSSQAGEGVLFVAIRGARFDGHSFIPGVIEAGTPAVCVDHAIGTTAMELVVPDTRKALGPLAAAVHHEPSRAMKVIGVTGTNGKTTVTHYIESLASSAGLASGLIGTIRTRVGGESVKSVRTTPEASDFQRLLAGMRDEGAELVIAEVSSHALEFGRVAATTFSVAAYTNLSQDHLDFHGDMESYRASKRKLFHEYEVGTAVVNVDDALGREIADEFGGDLLTVGVEGDISQSRMTPAGTDTEFTLSTPWGSGDVVVPVVGAFNVDNAVLAAACGLAIGIGFDDIISGLQILNSVPGRFELVSGDDPIQVIVDYAHTPDGVTQAVETARGLGGRDVIAVLGAGGDRDKTKRPLMGEAVSSADLAIITNDNPRSEDPAAIADAVLTGLNASVSLILDLDRYSAISKAIDLARDGDIVLILGRGHEPMQETAGEFMPFDDREVAREVLRRRRVSTDSVNDPGSMDK